MARGVTLQTAARALVVYSRSPTAAASGPSITVGSAMVPSPALAASRLRLLALEEGELQDLADRRLGQLAAEFDEFRQLDGRELVGQEGEQARRVERSTVVPHDKGLDGMTAIGIGHAHDRRLGDGGMLVDRLLDQARIDLVAARDDDLLEAVDDEEVAVLVHVA